jgi:hypothetical protein
MKGLRIGKRVQLLPGLFLNVSKSGVSLSLGVPGLTHNVDHKGKHRTTLSMPGTGVSYTHHHKKR